MIQTKNRCKEVDRMEMDWKYEADLRIANRAIEELIKYKEERTRQYEKELLLLRDL